MVEKTRAHMTVAQGAVAWAIAALLLAYPVALPPALAHAKEAALSEGQAALAPSAGQQLAVQDANATQLIGVTFPSATSSGKDIQVPLNYTDDLFRGPASTYNDDLGYASVCLASAAGYSNEGGSDYSNKGKNIRAFLTDIGCEDVTLNNAYGVKPMTVNNVGCAIGHKTVTEDGQAYQLFVIGVRGINYETEWAANFMVGASGEHMGFQDARDTVLSFALPYIADHTESGDHVKVWIAGYSRAGATTNLVGGWLDKWIFERNTGAPYAEYNDAYRENHTLLASGFDASTMRNTVREAFPPTYVDEGVLFSVDDVYCYPVSAPMGAEASDVEAHKDLTTNIHSMMNPDDWIGQIAMPWWGFARFGSAQDHDVTGTYANDGTLSAHDRALVEHNEVGLSAMIPRLRKINPSIAYEAPWFRQRYISFTKFDVAIDTKGEGNWYVSRGKELKFNQGGYYEEFMRYFLGGAGVTWRETYAGEGDYQYQADLIYLIQNTMGLSPEKNARLGGVLRNHLQAALRVEFDKPKLQIDRLGAFEKLRILKLVGGDEERLARVLDATLAGTLTELREPFDEARLTQASRTLAHMVRGGVQEDFGHFYHLITMAKGARGVGQAHMPEVILAWWNKDFSANVPATAKRTVKFYDNLDGDMDASNDQVVLTMAVHEGDTANFSNDALPTTAAGAAIANGVNFYDTPDRAGYTLDGWGTADGTRSFDSSDDIYYGDLDGAVGTASDALGAQDEGDEVSLFALWADDAVYTIGYHANNGSTDGDYDVQANAEDESLDIDASSFENDGMVFAGWNTAADGSGTAVAADARASLTQLGLLSTEEYHARLGALGDDPDEAALEALRASQTVNLYAQWQPASGEKSDSNGSEQGTDGTSKAAPSKGTLPTTGDPTWPGAACAGVAALLGMAALRVARRRRCE